MRDVFESLSTEIGELSIPLCGEAITEVCVADELASAAELVMGKTAGIAAAIVRGVDPTWLRQSSVSKEIIRPPSEDLFR